MVAGPSRVRRSLILSLDAFRDECGLFAVAGHRHAAHLTYLGLHAQQHRSAGERVGADIVASDGHLLRIHRGRSRVQKAFGGPELTGLTGRMAAGAVHSGAGMVFARYQLGQVAIGMSGRFNNGTRLRDELKDRGVAFQTTADAEVLLHLVATSRQRTIVNRLVDALWKVEGAFAVVVCTEDRLIAVRDPRGMRPLVLGSVDGATVVSTEDAAVRFVEATVAREVEPGEMVIVDAGRLRTVSPFAKRPRSACIHEYVTIARDDAEVFVQPVQPLRVGLGERLGREQPCAGAQVVVAMPGCESVAIGFAKVANVPYRPGLMQAPGADRRYIRPATGHEDLPVRLRWRAVGSVVEGRKVVLAAASLVTGKAISEAVQLLRVAGASEVHIRVASPEIKEGCPFGVASPTTDELASAAHGTPVQVGRALGGDSVAWLSLDGLHAIVGKRVDGTSLWCDGCFSGNWPLPPTEPDDQLGLFEPPSD